MTSEVDQELLLAFSDRMDLLNSEYTDYRHDKLLRHWTIMAEEIGELTDALENREFAEENPEPTGPVKCPRCGKETPRHDSVCVWCKQALDHAGIQSLEEDEKKVRETVLRLAKVNPE